MLVDEVEIGEMIALRAVDARRNIKREYGVLALGDLFGAITVDTWWGRSGATKQSLRRAFESEAEALCYVRQVLRRRATARKRIGVGYVRVN